MATAEMDYVNRGGGWSYNTSGVNSYNSQSGTISGLGFTPRVVIITCTSSRYAKCTFVYIADDASKYEQWSTVPLRQADSSPNFSVSISGDSFTFSISSDFNTVSDVRYMAFT